MVEFFLKYTDLVLLFALITNVDTQIDHGGLIIGLEDRPMMTMTTTPAMPATG